jgi:hypothetical protein
MIDRDTILAARRLVNRKRATCTDPNLATMLETLSINLKNLYNDPTDPDLLLALEENMKAVQQVPSPESVHVG